MAQIYAHLAPADEDIHRLWYRQREGEVIMFSLSDFIAACKFAKGAYDTRKPLSEEEKALLIAAEASLNFELIRVHEINYPVILVGGTPITKEGDDDLVRAKYCDALKSLRNRGFVEHESDASFTVNAAGLEKTRKLKSQQ